MTSTIGSNDSGKRIHNVVDFGPKQYILENVIGEGTYSKVRLAYLKINGAGDSDKKCACKIINRRQAGTEFNKKFLPREISILRTINHPNIVTVFDIADYNNTVYVFMGYCKHGDLLEYIRRKGSLSERRTKYLYKQIVSAVQYLHDSEIAHRDLKCENILLNGKNNIKVGDFGFARLCKNEKTGNRILSQTFCGSAAYAAPEIIRGAPYDPKMYDIWAMGCILYIMLTAQMPFDDSNIKKMLRFQQNRVICFSICYNMKITSPLKKVLLHVLEPDVSKRATISQISKSEWINVHESSRTASKKGSQR